MRALSINQKKVSPLSFPPVSHNHNVPTVQIPLQVKTLVEKMAITISRQDYKLKQISYWAILDTLQRTIVVGDPSVVVQVLLSEDKMYYCTE